LNSNREPLPCQLLEEFLLIQAVLEGFAPVDKNHRNFVREFALQQIIGFNVDFTPTEAAPAFEFRELLFHDLAQMASLAGIHDDFAKKRHRRESSKTRTPNPQKLHLRSKRKDLTGFNPERYNPLFMALPGTNSLDGKVALVTGAAKRLGRASAFALAEAGANVAITFLHSRNEAQQTLRELETRGRGVRGLAIRCDVTDPKSVRSAVKAVVQKFGGIDILINNAGNYETVEFEKTYSQAMGRYLRQ